MASESTILKQQTQIRALQSQLSDMTAERDEWRRIAQLAYTGADSDVMMRAFNPWKLTWKELGVLFAIMRRPNGVSRDQIMLALYSGAPVDDQPEIKVIDVFVCKVRRKLAEIDDERYALPRDTIKTLWGKGYRIDPDGHAKLTAILGYDPSALSLDDIKPPK